MQNTAARKLRQVPEGCLVIGIDPHKKKHAAVAITQDLTIHDRLSILFVHYSHASPIMDLEVSV